MFLIIGNWKLNGNRSMIVNFFTTLTKKLVNIKKCSVVIAVPVMYLSMARDYVINNNINLCAQNVDVNVVGAFTGDISAKMLKDIHTKYVLIGHSERRINYQESNLCVAQKFFVVKQEGLIPVLCIGENKEEYDAGYTYTVCIKQIDEIIKLLGVQSFENVVIAYEPLWSIGSGVSAVPENVQNIHKVIRNHIAMYDESIAKKLLIQYGGSVTAKNVLNFLNKSDIDGVLVGTASLEIDSFFEIISIAENCKKSLIL